MGAAVVSADTGLPLRRAKVSLRDAHEPHGRSVTTDAAGAFAFEAVPKGRYRLRASKARYVDRAGCAPDGSAGAGVRSADGQKVENLTIVLATAGVITGRVLDDGGGPMTGAYVMALRQRSVNGVTRLAPSEHARPTDDTGAYRLFGLEPGRYYLSVRPDDDRVSPDIDTSVTGLAPTYYPSTAMASEAQPIDVAAGAEAVADIALVATRVTTVSGEVFDTAGRPPSAASSCCTPRATTMTADTASVVRPGGGFTLSGVAPGDYTVGVRAFFDEAETMRIASTGTLDGAPAFSMPLSVSGEPIEDLRILVPPPVDVSGRVVFEEHTGRRRLRRRVCEHTLGDMDVGVRNPVGPDGRFTLRLRPGTWRFSPRTPPGWMVKRLTFRGTAVDPDAPVEVSGEPGGRLEVLLTSQLTAVTGTVSDASGAPVLEYHAIVFPAERPDPPHGRRHRTRLGTSDAGPVPLDRLPPGDYLVAAVVDVDPGEAVSDDTIDSVRESATPVRVREGQTETVALKLPPLP